MASQSAGLATITGRYASALFELADEARALDDVAADLRDLAGLIRANGDFRRALQSPVIGRTHQEKAVMAVLDKAGAKALTRRFVAVVTRNRRLFALAGIIDAFLAELARRRGEVRAEVTAPRALSDSQKSRLTEALQRAVGRNVVLDLKVDESVIGGLVVRVGSRMVDSSLQTQLQRLEYAMKGNG